MSKQRLFLGIDIGGTKIAAAILDSRTRVLASKRLIFHARSGKDVTESVIEVVRKLFSSAVINIEHIEAVGVGVPGTVDFKRGVVIFAPNLPLKNFPIKKILSKEYRQPIFIDNDANVAALGEKYLGAGRNISNFVYLTIGTGIGGAIVIDDKLYRGETGAAAEIGHMIINTYGPRCGCGNKGCLEAYSSGPAIARRATMSVSRKKSLISEIALKEGKGISAKVVADAAKCGDPLAIRILKEAGETLGQALVTLVNIFNPEKIIIGGGVAQAGSVFINPAKRIVGKLALEPSGRQVRVVRAKLGNNSGLIGAAVFAKTQGLRR